MIDAEIRILEAAVLLLQRIDGPRECPVAEAAERAENAILLLLDASASVGELEDCVPMVWP